MSKGSKIIQVRFPPSLFNKVLEAVDSANKNRKGEPYTMSDWIRKCVAEKLNHLLRSKRKGKRKNDEDNLMVLDLPGVVYESESSNIAADLLADPEEGVLHPS
jgi:hypothetical protein